MTQADPPEEKGKLPAHHHRPHALTRVDFSLAADGILEEEYTVEVLTHSRVIPYADVWDVFFDRTLPWQGWIAPALAAVSGIAAAALGHPIPAVLATFFAAGFVAAFVKFGWRFLFTAYDFDGQWLVTFSDKARPAFESFLGQFLTRIESRRYPLQKYLETMPLGEVSVSRPPLRWSCRYCYDRIVVEESGPGRTRRRRYYSLPTIRTPVRIAWRIPWILLALAGGLLAALAGLAVARHGLHPAAAFGPAAAVAAAAFALGARVAVRVPIGEQEWLVAPSFHWLHRSRCRDLLLWFSRLANLADRLEDVPAEDYWEYHRQKVTVLKDEGFLEEWPFRSALGKINQQEREEFGK